MEDWAVELIGGLVRSNQTGRVLSRFVEQIGATILGVKPACLIGVCSKQCFDLCRTHFTGDRPVGFIIVKRTGENKQLFLFHRESLQSVLSKTEIRRYLAGLGYPDDKSTEAYVRLLARRLRSDRFPHEIGLFFGYPLKDVCGFAGAPIPYRKTMGWRMYGDTSASERVYHRFRNARSHIRDMMRQAYQ